MRGETYSIIRRNGDLTNNGVGQTYAWDVKDELTQIAYSGGATSSFNYDGLPRRVGIIEKNNSGTVTSTKQFVRCNNQICEERDANDNVTKRFYPQGEQIAGASYYYTSDHLGNVREMCDSSGNIVARYEYDPYGRTTLVSGTDLASFQYAGMYKHQTSGFYLTEYRAYDPNTARWLSRDPAGEIDTDDGDDDDGTVGGMKLYGYVDNDPSNLYDSDGLGKERSRNADRVGHRGEKNSDKHENAESHGGKKKEGLITSQRDNKMAQ